MIYVYMTVISIVIALAGIGCLAIAEARRGRAADQMRGWEKAVLVVLGIILIFVLVCVLLGPVPIYD